MARKKHEETLPRKERWYYKNKETGKPAYSLREPLSNILSAEELDAYEEITAEEWDALLPKPVEPTAEQLAERAKQNQIAEAKAFLASTDWVVVKIAEETDAEEIAALREKYASVITERKAKRALINELEGE